MLILQLLPALRIQSFELHWAKTSREHPKEWKEASGGLAPHPLMPTHLPPAVAAPDMQGWGTESKGPQFDCMLSD